MSVNSHPPFYICAPLKTTMLTIEKLFQTASHSGSVYTVISEGDYQVYTAGSDGVILKWNIHEPSKPTAIAKVSGQIFSLCLYEPLMQLWVGTMSGAVHVLDLESKKEIHHFVNHTQSVFDIQPHADKIFVTSKDGNLTIWNAATSQLINTIHISSGGLRAIAFHPTKNEMAIGSSDNSIYIMERPKTEDRRPKEATIIQQLTAHTNSVFALCFSNDGKKLFSGGRDAMLFCWDAENNYAEIKSLPAHLYTINNLVLLSDNLFATASRDRTIKIWNAETIELLKVIDKEKFEGHLNSVNKLCWLNDEKILLSVSDDRSLIGWKISN